MSADPAMGGLGAHPAALLDRAFQSAHRPRPYHHPAHDRTVLCEPGGAARSAQRFSAAFDRSVDGILRDGGVGTIDFQKNSRILRYKT